LIDGGDWNDGMNRVGHEGRGESIWLGWFLHVNLMEFAGIAEQRGEAERAARWRSRAASVQASLEAQAWDGEWYKRAFFDDGTPLGSAQNDECQIDSIAQSWAVLSGAGDPQRARQAMASLEQRLVRRDDRLVLLFSPPFDQTTLDPGYIKGYVPGIRENGGQYTHAAVWAIVAFAMLGEGDKAGELFDLLNPIQNSSRRASLHRYKGEPYAVAADVYSQPPHVGRAGWTWYTGASGWLYRAGLESMLGFQKRGATLRIDPCIPRHWQQFEIRYLHGSSLYRIRVENPKGVCRGVSRVQLDGALLPRDAHIPLSDDGREHRVELGSFKIAARKICLRSNVWLMSEASSPTSSRRRAGEIVGRRGRGGLVTALRSVGGTAQWRWPGRRSPAPRRRARRGPDRGRATAVPARRGRRPGRPARRPRTTQRSL
jgi:cyclic beta-1,2-glucan synthetase